MSIIRNSDLSKMSYKALMIELNYLWDQATMRLTTIRHNTFLIKSGVTLVTPVWRLTEDYNLITERLQMVVEELQFRNIP